MEHTTEAIGSLAADLVAIDTSNPPGKEKACAEYIVEWFDERGIEADLVETPYPDRPQVGAEVGSGSPSIVLNGHIDVVPAGDRSKWERGPFDADIEDGLLHGRGSADMKTGVAIAMLATVELAEEIEDGELDGSVVFHAAMGEETAEPGTKTLLEEGYDGDYGVVLEPTTMRTATREKGLVWYEITVEGEPSHASRPDQGTNAIDAAKPVLDALEEYDETVRTRTDDLLGPAYATVTMFDAGTKENVVPESATLTVDRRVLPSESIAEIDDEIDDLVSAIEAEHGIDVTWERTRTYEAAAIDDDSELAGVFRKHSHDVAGVSEEPWGVTAATDVRNFINDAGIEAITWGPGDLDQAHTYNERIDLEQAADGLEALKRASRELLAGDAA